MKIFLSCKSLLIQRSLEFYLSGCLSPMEVCDFVLSDDEKLETNKPLCFIEECLRKPFTKQSVKEDIKILSRFKDERKTLRRNPIF